MFDGIAEHEGRKTRVGERDFFFLRNCVFYLLLLLIFFYLTI